ncbi:MAG: inverse autotransporter beta domain-containing protein [Dyella sp.]
MRTDSGWRHAKLAWVGSQLVAYLATTLMPAYAFPSSPRRGEETAISPGRGDTGTPTGTSTDLGSLLSGQLANTATGAASDLLNTLGTAQLDIDFDRHFNVRGGSLDLLVPWGDTKKRLDFTQVGVRHLYDRTTINLGAGQRYILGDWLLGYNGFLDVDPARAHRRVGLGFEVWRDYLKLATNGYLRLSDWKHSRLLADFDERPANGFDVRAEGYLPFHPQLGVKLAYERYIGRQVDLFSRDALRANPHAMTLGINYTPIPVLTFSVDHRQGNGPSDTRVGLQMNLQFDRSIKEQFDSSRMKSRRSLTGSRYDLVSRNNRIVMEYREQWLVQIGLPAEVKGLGRQSVPLPVSIESKRPLKQVVWQQDALVAAGGSVVDLGGGQYAVKLPEYNPSTTNSYTISAVAYDVGGQRSRAATTRATVTGPDIDLAKSSLTADPLVIQANGQDTSTLRIELRDGDGEPVAGMAAGFETELHEAVDTTAVAIEGQPAVLSDVAETEPGIYTATLTAATRPGVAHLAPRVVGTALGEIAVRMLYDSASAGIGQGDLTVDKPVIVANGVDTATYTVIVKNAFGAPARDIPVTWDTDVGDLSGKSSMTDAAGVATIRLTAAVLGVAQVTAQVGSQAAVNAPTVTLVSDHDTAMIGSGDVTVDKITLTAGTTDTATYTAIVKDAQGHPVPDATVNWERDLGRLGASSSITNAAGVATVTFTSTAVGIAQVSAQVGRQSAVNAPTVTIHEDSGSAAIGAGDLSVDTPSIVANGTTAATYTAIVRDAFGNPIPQLPVNWATDHESLSGTSSVTDAAGMATIRLTSTVSGTAQVTAQVGSQEAMRAPLVTVVFDPATVRLSLTATKTKITGTGADDAVLTATLVDAHNNPAAQQTVAWDAREGSLPSSTVTDANGQTQVTFNAINRTVSNVTANITATFASASQAQAMTVRAVQQVGGREYWTMTSDLNTDDEATAIAHCAANGGGTVTARSDFSAFIRDRGDFARMRVPGEYANVAYSTREEWGAVAGDFSSVNTGPGPNLTPGRGQAYVCVR